ncbi:MAG: hypothetical protein J0H53_03915 [Rhizobiales bacterium]|nr:hypothetical protein [Hyphomicrobiales bacterium]OJU30174.1 MAG: hypothetical protein BGN94_14470 [Rhizobiales bacterium 68-8]
MTPTTLFEPESGMRRLLSAPSDIEPRDYPVLRREAAPQAFQALYDEYRERLWRAHLVAVPWWEDTIRAQERLGRSRAEAVDVSFDKRIAGAAAHPAVVHVLRECWLRCVELCEAYPGREVAPETLLLQWLADAGETDLVAVVTCMPYWPIGMDADGNWV